MSASLKLTLTPASQDIAANKSRVRVRLTISTAYGTYNELGTTAGSITLDGVKIADLKGKKVYINTTTVLYDAEHDVAHNADGRKTVTASASFDVETSVRWISAAAELELQRIPRASGITFPTIVLGSANALELTRAVDSYEDEVFFALGAESGVVSARTADKALIWTPPLELAAQIINSTTGVGTLTVVTYSGEEEIGRQSYTFTAQVPDDVKPSVSAVLTDANGWRDKYGAYIQTRSKLSVALTGTGAYGSDITAYRISVDSVAYEAQEVSVDLPNESSALPVKARALDSRGRWSDEFSTTIQVLGYRPPTVTALIAGRCDVQGAAQADGAYMSLVFSASVSALNNLNSAEYYAQYRATEDDGWHTVMLPDLSGVYDPSNAGAIIAADLTKAYEVTILARDDFASVSSKVATIPIAFTFFSFDAKTRSFAFFQLAVEPDTFRIADGMAVRLPGDTHIGDKLWLDRTYPIGSLYLTVADVSPADLFGGTWERIEDTFLLAAGANYEAGTTGGEAEHTLTVEELPSHRHMMNGLEVSRTEGGYVAARSATFSQQTDDGTTYTDYEGGGAAHNNMPPFLAVYMWQRVEDPVPGDPDEPDSGLTVTDDGAGNVAIAATGSASITDDGAGNVTIADAGSTSIEDDGAGNVTIA